MSGHGDVVADVLLTALLWLTALVHFALIRDRGFHESAKRESYRWLIVAGTLGLAVRFTFLLADTGDLLISPYSVISLALVSLGALSMGMDQLLRERA